jgi:hypothetical protein
MKVRDDVVGVVQGHINAGIGKDDPGDAANSEQENETHSP